MADSAASSASLSASSPVDGGVSEPIGSSGIASLATTALALVFVLALAWVLLRLLKRLQQRGGLGSAQADAPQVLRSVGLGPRERLVTVRWRGREYLLGVTPGSVTLIDRDLDLDAIEPAPDAARPV